MKKLVLLSAALLVAGCGEKSSSEGSESASEDPTGSRKVAKSSARTARPAPSKPRIAESSSKEPSNTPNSLSDADVERLLKEAVDFESFEEREGLFYHANESEPFSGWAKEMAGSGQVSRLGRFKDGKQGGFTTVWYGNGQKMTEETYKDGKRNDLWTVWHENGQKKAEATYKDGKVDGLRTSWHENGQKWEEETYKDGEVVSVKYWNSKGEEVETSFDSLE